jgi:multiple sugar transport system substrate-binding protein
MRHFVPRLLPIIIALLLLAACGRSNTPAASEPAAPSASAELTPAEETPPAQEEVSPEAETPVAQTPPPEAGPVVVDFWTTDNEPSRLAAYEAVALRYMEQNPGVEVRIRGVDETTVAADVVEAAADGVGPDLVRLGLERTAVLIRNNLLDFGAAEAVVDAVGREDFRKGPLAMTTARNTGELFAVPYDGWVQALWYRRDLFESAGLTPPINWADLNAACDELAADPSVGAALSLPSDPASSYTHQVFEQVAMSNEAWPFDAEGNVTMNTPAMIDALRFYTDLQRCSLASPQNLFTAREAYELGQTAMLFYSTYIMDDLVEGSERQDGSRVEIAVDDLPAKSGFASGMAGPQGSATYGQLVTLALLHDAPPETQDVAHFFLTSGYYDIIKTAPLGKIPVRESALQDWTALSPIFSYYSDATLGYIAGSYDLMKRWIFQPEYGAVERLTVSEIEQELLVPQAIAMILDGSMTPEEAAAWLQSQVETLVAENLAETQG